MDDLLSIGELSRRSGLSVSALRFYDVRGVFTPARVDPVTGYRRYSPAQVRTARVLAGLRRLGLPLAEMTVVLGRLDDVAQARGIVAAHLRRLEAGLEDARAEAVRIETLLVPPDGAELVVSRAELVRALAAVRHAVASPEDADGEWGVLTGIQLSARGSRLRVAATDRYRLVVTHVEARSPMDRPWEFVLPAAAADAWIAGPVDETNPWIGLCWRSDGPAGVLHGVGPVVTGLSGAYPDVGRLAPGDGIGTTVEVDAATDRLRDSTDATVEVSSRGVLGEDGVRLDRTFLLEALLAIPGEQATLALDGPIGPLAIRPVGDETTFSLIMPVQPS